VIGIDPMTEPVPPYFSHDVNRRVVRHVAPLSAHSDIVDVLMTAITPLAQPDSDWPAVDVTFWARKAYVYAREFPAPSL
jgi:hypothetical protein